MGVQKRAGGLAHCNIRNIIEYGQDVFNPVITLWFHQARPQANYLETVNDCIAPLFMKKKVALNAARALAIPTNPPLPDKNSLQMAAAGH